MWSAEPENKIIHFQPRKRHIRSFDTFCWQFLSQNFISKKYGKIIIHDQPQYLYVQVYMHMCVRVWKRCNTLCAILPVDDIVDTWITHEICENVPIYIFIVVTLNTHTIPLFFFYASNIILVQEECDSWFLIYLQWYVTVSAIPPPQLLHTGLQQHHQRTTRILTLAQFVLLIKLYIHIALHKFLIFFSCWVLVLIDSRHIVETSTYSI